MSTAVKIVLGRAIVITAALMLSFSSLATAQAPPVPTLIPEPPYTGGDSNTVAWSDESVGGAVAYKIQVASDADFASILDETNWITATQATFTGLPNAVEGWYRVRSIDLSFQMSAWSDSLSSIQDAETPVSTVAPITMEDPGLPFDVSFAAVDTLSGVAAIELSYVHDGGPAVVYASSTTDTTIVFQPLAGSGTYAFTSRAFDLVGNLEPVHAMPDQVVVVPAYPWVDIAPTDGSGIGNDGNSRGMSTVDWDGDGDHDMFITNRVLYSSPGESINRLFRNDGPDIADDDAWIFPEVTPVNMQDPLNGQGLAWGDFDGDGDLDLYTSNMTVVDTYPQENSLFRNDGGGVFTDIAPAAGLDDGGSGRSCSWCDYDQDGDLDLYLCNKGENFLWRNDGYDVLNPNSWLFVNVAPISGVDDPQYTMGCAWSDYDNDGDPDLFLASYGGDINKLFRNDGPSPATPGEWVFTDVAPALGLDDATDSEGPIWGDFDNDGWVDLYVSNNGPNRLYRNLGGTFVEIAADSGDNLNDSQYGAGCGWADYDNDGDLDLFQGNHFPNVGPEWSNNFLFRNEGVPGAAPGSWTFSDVSPPNYALMADTLNTNGVAWFDYDDDGDLDLTYSTMSGGPNRLFRNDVANATGNHWFQLDLTDTSMNTCAIGARVIVYHAGGLALREINGGMGFLSQESLTLEFGVGTSTVLDSVVIRWPDGEFESLLGFPVDRRLPYTRGVTPVESVPLAALALDRNVPNPFNPSTRIAFELPSHGRAVLTVHDIAGRRVATLVDAELQAGSHAVIWRGRDLHGASVASGVYLARLTTADGVRMRRMVLLR